MARNHCKQKGIDPGPARAGALYVHVPFCRAKCAYCDFYSVPLDTSPKSDPARRYVRAARRELSLRAEHLDGPLQSVYIGGGTPTALDAELLRELLAAVAEWIGPETEFSIEANPGTLVPGGPAGLAGLGVNRMTLGVQSFDDAELRLLGRIHDAEQARQAVRIVRDGGIENVGLDLIYAIPGQSLDSWRASLQEALDLGIRHLSCYALSLEPGTPLAAELRACEVDELLQRDMYDLAREMISASGLEHYEISNFAVPGFACRHNTTYWHNEPYVGIGPAAVGFVGGVRAKNPPDLAAYLRAIEADRLPDAETERLTGRAEMAETLMLGLRLIEGVERKWFASRFGQDPVDAFPDTFSRYAALGAVLIEPWRVRLSAEALFVADSVLADLLAEA